MASLRNRSDKNFNKVLPGTGVTDAILKNKTA
jgi:hypothetical protein